MAAMHQPGRGYLAAKRAIDVAGACIGLLVLGVLLPPIAMAIKASSRGPIFFVQDRVGKDGKLFPVLKCRTMRAGTLSIEQGLLHEEVGITVVGRFLRRTGLDEMPQFINVLRGEMSLVGPRPELPQLYALYAPWQRRRVEVLPGMTGWWQVHGRPQPMIDHIRYDIEYIENRSLGLDLRILLLTIPSLLVASHTSSAGRDARARRRAGVQQKTCGGPLVGKPPASSPIHERAAEPSGQRFPATHAGQEQ